MLMKCKMTHSHKTIANIPSKHCQSGNAIKWCQPIKHLSCSCQLHGHLPFSHGILHLKLSAQLKEYDAKTFKTLMHLWYLCLMMWLYDVVPWGKSQKKNAKPKGMQAVVLFYLTFIPSEELWCILTCTCPSSLRHPQNICSISWQWGNFLNL